MLRLAVKIEPGTHQIETLTTALREYEASFHTRPILLRIVDERLYQGADNKPENGGRGIDCGSSLIISEPNKDGRSEYYLLRVLKDEYGQTVPMKLSVSITGDIGQENHVAGANRIEVTPEQRVSLAGGIQAHFRYLNTDGQLIKDYVRETRNGDLITDSGDSSILAEAAVLLTAFNTACFAISLD